MGDSLARSQSGLDTQSTKKRGRGATRMKKLQLMAGRDERLSIDFQSDGLPSGQLAKKFKKHLAALARERVSILIDEWDNVGTEDRDEIWKGVKQLWDIPNNEVVKKKMMVYAGDRWKAFKTSLTTRYLFGGYKSHECPTATYPYIDKEIWEQFVKSREDPTFLDKRKKGQETQSHNKYPHRMSQGGYDLIEKIIIEEKLKERQESTGGSEVPPPSPPSRHEKWKRARLKPSGEYTSEATRLVAEKIDSLVSEGTFVPQGRNDILAEATGRGEHPGRVRAAGVGVGIRAYFGSCSRQHLTPPAMDKNQLQAIKAELTKDIREQVIREITSMPGFSQQHSNHPAASPTLTGSTKERCSGLPPMPNDDEEDIPEECKLYIDGNNHVVAHANVYRLGPIIHNQVLNNDMVRVAIIKVIDANAKVPVPTDEVTRVGEAINTFIQWPKRLLQLISNKAYNVPPKTSEPLCRKLGVKAMYLDQPLKFIDETGGKDAFIELPKEDIIDLCMGTKELNATILRVWLIYLHRHCIELGKNDTYGFIDPHFTHSQNDCGSVQSYIQNKMCHDKKDCYLVPYFSTCHWQLLILNPKKFKVVFLCSLGKRPDKRIHDTVELALGVYNKLQRERKKKVEWFYPTSQKQQVGYECGYYVMIHMLNIVSAGVVDSWMQIFRDSNPYHKDEVKIVQERCASLILEHIEANADDDMN